MMMNEAVKSLCHGMWHPIDLGTGKSKLNKDLYTTVDRFADDVRLASFPHYSSNNGGQGDETRIPVLTGSTGVQRIGRRNNILVRFKCHPKSPKNRIVSSFEATLMEEDIEKGKGLP
ncbi:hypothetical protein L484_025990 [Morus notabilis]|uniref:Uncharacterized protein n=1 Tax=Morus notabilis TaxID=981085 RepID=W9RWA8_9ROSA|nr:hypothetical protein L484_025990 [Morus notabilis]